MKILENVKLGKNVVIRDFVNLYDCEIGDNTKIASFVEIQRGVKIGKNCKIEPFAFIPSGVTIKDGVFIGPGAFFTNDKIPRATTETGSIKKDQDWKLLETIVEKNSSIGSNATILPGISIGEGSIVGAGSVVTKNVPAKKIVAGNPAKIIGDVKE